MPIFVLIGRDGPRGRELRRQHRAAHLAGLEPLEAEGRLRFAGPLRDESGESCGSVIVFDAPDLARARTLAESDPYVAQGVFEGFELYESIQVFPRPR